jgi:hypothetical protein
MNPTQLSPRTLALISAISHAAVGVTIIVGMVFGRIQTDIGVPILAGLGSFWGGLGVALKSSGTSTAATVTGGGSVPSASAPSPPQSDPTSGPVPTHAPAPLT